jgi:hypothetical protein
MRHRDMLSLRQLREEREAIERADREERERPVREAVATAQSLHQQIAAVRRERLTTIPDPERWLDPAVGPDVRFTQADARKFNAEQSNLYRQSHPETYWCPELVELLGAYFDKERISLVTATMLERLISRFDEVGLLPQRPIEPEPEPEEEQPVITTVQPPATEIGIDPLTGLEREYTAREVRLMSADQWRRCFRITKADLMLPTHSAF